MLCEPSEYTNAARNKDKATTEELFNYDDEILKENLALARPPSTKMQPALQSAMQTIKEKLLRLVTKMNSPLAENFLVANTFASDGDRYFHYPSTEKWRRKLVQLQPEEGTVTVIELPNSFDMKDSHIF